MDLILKSQHLHPEQMLANVTGFMDKINLLASDLGLEISKYPLDHIALRINDIKLAKMAHLAWLDWGEQISSAEINGRPIIVLLFNQPFMVQGWPIECLELPYPAAGKPYPQQGWEHVEFVIPSDAETAEAYLADLSQQLTSLDQQWSALEKKGIKIKLSSPKGDRERLANPTVAFKRDGVCIKLHPHSLKDVVASERSVF